MLKQKNIPEIRFPEFKEEWEKKKLGENCEVLMCKRIFAEETNQNEEIPFYKIGSIGSEPDVFISRKLFDEYKNRYNYPQKGEILITCSGTVGKCVPYDGNDAYYQDSNIVWIDNPTSNIENKLLYYLLMNINWRKLNSTTITRIYGSDLRNLILVYPVDKSEQKIIASFFTVIDEKLKFLKKKKELLEQYKKGVMKKIFSQELRFKDDIGKEFPKWELKRLAKVSIKNSSNLSANKIEDNFGEYIIYGASGVLKKIDFFREKEEYISIVKDGAGVGRIFLCEPKSSVLGTLDIIKPYNSNIYYLYYLLQKINFAKYITGSTIPHIYYKDYKDEKIMVPCLEEQTKIANFLTAIDKKINYTQTQIEKAEIWKKGLLQKMFC